MKVQQLIDKILNNWPAKIICLMLAIFLYIFHQASMIDKKVFVVPLEVIENGNVMQIGDCPNVVSVIVRASTDVINSIISSDLEASINLDKITTSGKYTVPVTINISDRLKEYDPLEIRVQPEHVNLSVETKISKYVPINPSISGEVKEGYEISEVIVNPSSVCIIGPESLVENTKNIQTTALIVSNAELNFTGEINYLELNKYLYVEDKGPYKATVIVNPKPMEKEYVGIHVVVKGLLENLEIENEIPDIDFVLSGTVPILSKYIISANLIQIDLREITEPGNYEVPVKFNLPANIILEKQSFETISVNVIEKQIVDENINDSKENIQ